MKRSRKSKVGGAAIALLALMLLVVDLMSNTSATGLLVSAISIPHINVPPRDVSNKRVSVSPKAIFIQIRWPNGFPHDIDTYVRCYQIVNGQKQNRLDVNYQQRSHRWLDLNRDDLGRPGMLNTEEVQSNSQVGKIPPNTFCQINAHLYHSHSGVLPVQGELLVIADKDADNEELLAALVFTFEKAGNELVLFTARWDNKGLVIKNSITIYPQAEGDFIARNRPSFGGGR